MYKKYKYLFISLFCLIFINNSCLALTGSVLNSDYKNTYINYANALREEKTPLNYLNMCKITLELNDSENARKYCKQALNEIEKEKNPDYELKSEILSTNGDIYSTVYRNSDITFDYYKQAQEYKESNPDTDKYNLAKLYRNIANTYDYIGRNDIAKQYRKKALDITENSEDKKYNFLSSLVYKDMALSEDVNSVSYKSYLDKALKYGEDTGEYKNHKLLADIYKNLADYYENSKHDKKTAVDFYRKSSQENAKFPDENLLTREEDVPENTTIEDIKQILAEYPYDIDYNVMAGAYYISRNDKKAQEYFQKAINVNTDNSFVYAAISEAYAEKYSQANFKEYLENARKYAVLASEKAGYEPDLYLTLGVIYFHLGSVKTANNYFNDYIKYSDDKSDAYCEIASVYWYNDVKQKYRKQVISNLEKAKNIKELNPMYKVMLMAAYRQTGNTKAADNMATQFLKDQAVFEN